MTKHVYLIVGTGSVGRRHAKNLVSLGAKVACFDPRADRLEEARRAVPELVATYDHLEAALADTADLAGAVVCSPPSFHAPQAIQFLERGIPVLLEKPVSPDLTSARRLERAVNAASVPLLLGYTYRWWPPFVDLRQRLRSGEIGPPRHARIVMSAHLADWHPWERYQDFFMASQELGGGALLDESHFIDLMLWLFGAPDAILGRTEHLSDLEITTDDTVDLIAVYRERLRVNIHLDLYGRPHEKSVTVVGEKGTAQVLFEPNVVRISSEAAGWRETPFTCDRNDMFLACVREFMDVVSGTGGPSCTIADGVRVLECVEATRASQARGQTIAMTGA